MVKRQTKYNWKLRPLRLQQKKMMDNLNSMIYADRHQSEYTMGLQGLKNVIQSSTIYGSGDSADRSVNAL